MNQKNRNTLKVYDIYASTYFPPQDRENSQGDISTKTKVREQGSGQQTNNGHKRYFELFFI